MNDSKVNCVVPITLYLNMENALIFCTFYKIFLMFLFNRLECYVHKK